MTRALQHQSTDTIFALQGDAGVHVDQAGTRTPCTVIWSESRDTPSEFAFIESVGNRRMVSVRESEVAKVLTEDQFELAWGTYRVDARIERPGEYGTITVAVAPA